MTLAKTARRSAGLVILLLVAACIVAGQAVYEQKAPERVEAIYGPLLTSLSPTRAALVWESHKQGDGAIVYTPQGDVQAAPVTVKSTVTRVPGRDARVTPRTRWFHRVTLDGLKAATAYSYRVTVGDDRKGPFTFTTPEAHPKEIVFAAYGDSRHGTDVHRRIVKMISKYPVQFVVHTGDMVTFGGDADGWETEWAQCLEGLGERVPIYATLGNHDEGPYYVPWCLPLGTASSYGFDWGNAHFYCLDNVEPTADCLAAAEKDLAASKAEWKFVFYHEPTINYGGHASHWEFPDAIKAWDRAGVDFVLAGHSHLYERVRPVRATAESTHVTNYVTTGGGGAFLYPTAKDPHLAASAQDYHFCIFTIKGRTLTMKVISVDGAVIDQLTVDKTDAKSLAPLLKTAVLIGDL